MEKIFCFEDLVYFSNEQITELLREIDVTKLVIALKNSSGVQEKIFSSVSKRASVMLQEDIEFMGPVRLKDVEAEQENIIEHIFNLFGKDGKLTLPNGNPEVVYVKNYDKEPADVNKINETILIDSPDGEKVELSYCDIYFVSSPVLTEVIKRFSYFDLAVGNKFTERSQDYSILTERAKKRLAQELAECTEEDCRNKQREILEFIKKLADEKKVKTITGFLVDDFPGLDDRAMQKVLREIDATTSEKSSEFEKLAQPYNELITGDILLTYDSDIIEESDGWSSKTNVLADFVSEIKKCNQDYENLESLSLNEDDIDNKAVEEINARLKEYIDKHKLPDDYVSKVLEDADKILPVFLVASNYLIASGLKNVPFKVTDKFFSNMAPKYADNLQQAIEYVNPSEKEIEEIQKNWCSIVKRLEDAGEIVMYRKISDNLIY